MKLYNTLTKSIEDFKPLKMGIVSIYSCGPTVYDNVHIGNLFSFIFADTLRRTIACNSYSVKHVMNFTDVDDKTIRNSQKEYGNTEPMAALMRLTNHYGNIFLKDMQSVGNDNDAITFIKATDSIEGMKELILKLLNTGYAYITDDGVYFSIEAYRKSGKIYGQLTEITESSTGEERIDND
jgi:cysteinyl-tRNA synthetase